MIKEVLIGPENGGADFAVADLSVTSTRANVVDFSMPFMTLGERRDLIKQTPAVISTHTDYIGGASTDTYVNFSIQYPSKVGHCMPRIH